MHIQLRQWADILVIAPLSANTLAKLAQVAGKIATHALQAALPSVASHVPVSLVRVLINSRYT